MIEHSLSQFEVSTSNQSDSYNEFAKKISGDPFRQPAASDCLKIGQGSDLTKTGNEMLASMSAGKFTPAGSPFPAHEGTNRFMMNVFADIELFYSKKKDFLIFA